jgi:small subunit ribosomal protein S6
VREYEFTFIVQPEITDEGLQAICARYEGAVEKAGATKLFYEDWGRRRLAYEIQKFQKGHYMVLHFLDQGKAVPELERISRQDDTILRFLTVLANPSVEDIESRKQEAVGLEEDRIKKAAERAVREAEEAAARAAEAEARAAEIEAAVAAAEVPAEVPAEAGAEEAAGEDESPAAAEAAATPAEETPTQDAGEKPE